MAVYELQQRLDQGEFVLMDGGLGTEIARRGVELGTKSWSAHPLLSEQGQQVIKDIHTDYLDVYAKMLIADSFRTPALDSLAEQATTTAVELAIEAREDSGYSDVTVAGSIGPVADCYRPDLTPPNDILRSVHRPHAKHLAAAAADLALAETMNTVRETQIALAAGAEAGLPVAVSFICSQDGRRLLSGEAIEVAIEAADEFEPVFIGFNCVNPNTATNAVEYLAGLAIDKPVAVYAQGYDPTSPDHVEGVSEADYPAFYLRKAREWRELGAQIIGGCCGTDPDYISAIGRQFQAAGLVSFTSDRR